MRALHLGPERPQPSQSPHICRVGFRPAYLKKEVGRGASHFAAISAAGIVAAAAVVAAPAAAVVATPATTVVAASAATAVAAAAPAAVSAAAPAAAEEDDDENDPQAGVVVSIVKPHDEHLSLRF